MNCVCAGVVQGATASWIELRKIVADDFQRVSTINHFPGFNYLWEFPAKICFKVSKYKMQLSSKKELFSFFYQITKSYPQGLRGLDIFVLL